MSDLLHELGLGGVLSSDSAGLFIVERSRRRGHAQEERRDGEPSSRYPEHFKIDGQRSGCCTVSFDVFVSSAAPPRE